LKPLLLFLLLITSVIANDKGSASLFLFMNGKPIVEAQVEIDNKVTYKSNNKGTVKLFLETGLHSATIKEDGIAIASARFAIVKEEDTQVIFTLYEDKTREAKIDIEVSGNQNENATKEAIEAEKKKPKGSYTANVVSSEKQEAISGAKVYVKGRAVDTNTDESGNFELTLPEGSYTISVIHPSFSTQNSDIEIIAHQKNHAKIELTPASMELAEFVVLVPYIEGSLASVLQEEKKSKSIASILSAEQFSKKGDSSAAAALKRVTGVTLVGGKSIYVRGLGERYANVEMNSMPVLSPDPTKRVVPLDIFPSSVIGSLKVQKSATADTPASFGGGYIDIRTKNSSADTYIKVSLGLSANRDTHSSVNDYKGGDYDWTGHDGGYRAIDGVITDNIKVQVGQRPPSATKENFTEEDLNFLTQKLVDRNYLVRQRTLPIGFGGSIEAVKSIKIDENSQLSISGNYGYSQRHKYKEEKYYNYEFDKATNKLKKAIDQQGTISKANSEFSHGGILNIAYTNKDSYKVVLTSLYTVSSEKGTRIADGVTGSNDDYKIRTYLDWEERTLNVNQLNGEYNYELLGAESQFKFGAEVAFANLYQPNNFSYDYIKQKDTFVVDVTGGQNHIAQKLTSSDVLSALYFKNRLNDTLLSDEDYVEFGYSVSSKERESRQSKYALRDTNPTAFSGDIESFYNENVRPEIEYGERDYVLTTLFAPGDSFDAKVDESAVYLNKYIKPVESIGIMAGVRMVDFTQTLWQFKQDRSNPDISKRTIIDRVPESLALDEVLPSLNMKYTLDDENIFDLAFSKTYIVPDLREFSGGSYFHPYDVATVKGNPDLVNTDITNIDFKYSHYFSQTEMIKFGLFYKALENPIEDILNPSSSLPEYSFINSESAQLQGIEVDGRKNFEMISPQLEDFYIAGNFSYTDSLVTLTDKQKKIYSSHARQLQGLSQTVLNLTVGYENDADSVVLTYNQMGERIRKVGLIDDGDAFPDYYEIPPQLLDFVWSKKFENGFSTKVKIQNILDSKTVWKQGQDNVTKEFKMGRSVGVSMAYKY
jgi:TonB-dependent receptor